ncbi:MAG: SigB/SigF/SigG family RNA polymerase sigma factor [Capsulimonadaceae bacterium]
MNESATLDSSDSVSETVSSSDRCGAHKERTLFERYAESHDPNLRDRLVQEYDRLARYLASKFGGRGEPLEDLLQVARLGLIKSVDRFDPSRGLRFTTYATPTIVGEIQRHFRDRAWTVKVPRGMQELNGRALRAKDLLSGHLGRVPTVLEVAHAIGATEEATLAAIELTTAYAPSSLDSFGTSDEESHMADLVGAEDPRLEAIVDNDGLNSAITSLDAREQGIVNDYYFREMTEVQIAQKLCISQMHVSRLKKRALSNLEKYMAAAELWDRE